MSEIPPIKEETIVEIGSRYGIEIDTSLSRTEMFNQLKEHIGSLSKEQYYVLPRIAS